MVRRGFVERTIEETLPAAYNSEHNGSLLTGLAILALVFVYALFCVVYNQSVRDRLDPFYLADASEGIPSTHPYRDSYERWMAHYDTESDRFNNVLRLVFFVAVLLLVVAAFLCTYFWPKRRDEALLDAAGFLSCECFTFTGRGRGVAPHFTDPSPTPRNQTPRDDMPLLGELDRGLVHEAFRWWSHALILSR